MRALPALVLLATLAPLAHAEPKLFFDDFQYTDRQAMAAKGWIVRTGSGWPGVEGAQFWADGVRVIADPADKNNRLLQLRAATDGTAKGTRQAQLCHARKYLEGTYAARVRFHDAPVSGPDGDPIVETFYLISPLKAPKDPDYSEADFEYLPNGGWGSNGAYFYATTWETFIPAPNFWKDNQYDRVAGSQEGWHTLVLTIAGQQVNYFLDGKPFARHGGDYYPEVPMSINFNLWFTGLASLGPARREYQQEVDWVLHVKDEVLTPAQVNEQVKTLRGAKVPFRDTVPTRGLPSPCNL
ncbi:glycoside hydrolase family 16 protein [Chitiniphilus eburneus]|uniref:glycoside hydrolase family 16 protein n=1 Tax=Chitiniphilus eburneus TaxID=2571148 RepID=UPI0035D0C5E3